MKKVLIVATMVFISTIGTTNVYAHAPKTDVLITPPLVVQSPDVLFCQIVNVSKESRQVEVDVVDINGSKLGGTTQILEPNHVVETGIGAGTLVPRYCIFTVDGKKTDFRASGSVATSFGSSIAVIPAK